MRPLFIGGPVDDDNHPTCSSSTTESPHSSATMNEAAAANNEMKALPSPEPSYQITSMYTNSENSLIQSLLFRFV